MTFMLSHSGKACIERLPSMEESYLQCERLTSEELLNLKDNSKALDGINKSTWKEIVKDWRIFQSFFHNKKKLFI